MEEKYQNAWPIESFITITFKTWRDGNREREKMTKVAKKAGNQETSESELTVESELEETVGEALAKRTTRSTGQTK